MMYIEIWVLASVLQATSSSRTCICGKALQALDKKVVANPTPRIRVQRTVVRRAHDSLASRKHPLSEETEAQDALETEELRALTPPDRSESRDRITTQA